MSIHEYKCAIDAVNNQLFDTYNGDVKKDAVMTGTDCGFNVCDYEDIEDMSIVDPAVRI